MKDLLLCCYFLAFLEFREIKSNDLIVIPQIFSGMLRSLLICRNFSNMTVVLSLGTCWKHILKMHITWEIVNPYNLLVTPLRLGFPACGSGKEPICHCKRYRRHGFDPWVRKIPWRRAWQPTPVFLPRKSSEQRSLVGYSPWGHKQSDTTETT